MISIQPKDAGMQELYGLVSGAVGPRPIAFVSTLDENGTANLSPFSYFNVFSMNPPILAFSPARSGRDNTVKDTLKNVLSTKEAVISVVTYDMVQQMSLTSSPFPSDVDEFVKAGFTKLESELVKPYGVAEAPVQFECKVNDVIELGQEGGAGNLVLCEIINIHVKEEVLDGSGKMIDQEKIDLVSRMGGNWYCRADKNSMFEIPKPVAKIGIGFDNIPSDILESKILTGNNLGQLGSVEALPNETDVNEYKLIELSDLFVELEDEQAKLELELHKRAQLLLDENKLDEAWKTLLAFNN